MKITKPTLLIDPQKARRNIHKMVKLAEQSQVQLRPHFKTHISARVGEWFKEYGIDTIAVSSVDMARYFSDNGWRDITIAFPVNILQIDDLNILNSRCDLNLLVESEETVLFLGKNLHGRAGAWIKVDIGTHRTGISHDHKAEILHLSRLIESSRKLQLMGLLAHAGHTYNVRGAAAIQNIYQTSLRHLTGLRKYLSHYGFENLKISYGDTPSCSVVEDLSQVNEIRCGNFVFYDLMQYFIGSCSLEEIAVAVAAPIVARHPQRNEMVLYCGAIHLSKESVRDQEGKEVFGYPAILGNDHWGQIIPGSYVSRISQEHGILKVPASVFSHHNIGDLVAILPVHSCLTVNLMQEYTLLGGDKIPTLHSQK